MLSLVRDLVIYLRVSFLFYGLFVPLVYDGFNSGEIIPPGWEWVDSIVGIVWFVLLAAMVCFAWAATRRAADQAARVRRLLLAYVVWCFLYTPVFGWTHVTGLVGNLLTLLVATPLTIYLTRKWWPSAVPVGLSVIWVSIASVYVAKLIQLNG